jgi:hypothetical protein
MSVKVLRLRRAENGRNATSRAKERHGNDAYRVREHLAERARTRSAALGMPTLPTKTSREYGMGPCHA